MRQKLNVSTVTQKVEKIGMWIVIVSFLLLLFIVPSRVKAETVLPETEIKQPVPKNPSLKAYHKMQRKMERNCSLCKPKGLRKLLPKSWR